MKDSDARAWTHCMEGAAPEIKNAMEYLRNRAAATAEDVTRPGYHYTPPAGMMIDTWGGIRYRDKFHVFYDINTDGRMERFAGSVAHLRSEDLLHWEQMPIALTPSDEKDELRCNDGCVVIDPSGSPLMYYTSVFYNDGPSRPREHTPVRGDCEMVVWKRIPGADPLTIWNHGGPSFKHGWSDPWIFTQGGRTFMLLSKCVGAGGEQRIPVYEALDDSWLRWAYRGILFEDTGEVVNFIRVGGRWVLIYCPYNDPVYHVGDFDGESCRFISRHKGVLSRGYVSQGDEHGGISRGFYATTVFNAADDRVMMLGWVSGFLASQGWAGCISLPRQLEVDGNDRLRMAPADEVAALRRRTVGIRAGDSVHCAATFELECDMSPGVSGSVLIEADGSVLIRMTEDEIHVADISVPCTEKHVHLRAFVDVSLIEVFFDCDICSVTRCIRPLHDDTRLRVVASGCRVDNILLHTLAL